MGLGESKECVCKCEEEEVATCSPGDEGCEKPAEKVEEAKKTEEADEPTKEKPEE